MIVDIQIAKYNFLKDKEPSCSLTRMNAIINNVHVITHGTCDL